MLIWARVSTDYNNDAWRSLVMQWSPCAAQETSVDHRVLHEIGMFWRLFASKSRLLFDCFCLIISYYFCNCFGISSAGVRPTYLPIQPSTKKIMFWAETIGNGKHVLCRNAAHKLAALTVYPYETLLISMAVTNQRNRLNTEDATILHYIMR